MQLPVDVHVELTSDQATRLVREVLTFNLSSCKSTESQNILRKAILILNAQDDVHWISETYSTSSTQTYPCNEDSVSECTSIKEECRVQDTEFLTDHFGGDVGAETHPTTKPKIESDSLQGFSANTHIHDYTLTQAEDNCLLDSNTQLPLVRTDRTVQRCGSDCLKSHNYMDAPTSEPTDINNSMVVFEICSSEPKEVVIDASLVQLENEISHSLSLEKQDAVPTALIMTLQEESRTTGSPIWISNLVNNISQPENNSAQGEVLPSVISTTEKTSAMSGEIPACVELNTAKTPIAASKTAKEKKGGERETFEGFRQDSDEGSKSAVEKFLNLKNHEPTVYEHFTKRSRRNEFEKTLRTGTSLNTDRSIEEGKVEDDIPRVILRPGSVNIMVSKVPNARHDLSTSSIYKRTFSKKDDLTIRNGSHIEEKTFKCTTCNRSFSKKRTVIKHNEAHREEKTFQCPSCTTAFPRTSIFFEPTRTHRVNKPYKCGTCYRMLSCKASLVKHTRTHTGEKPFKCKTCNKAFTQSQTLTVHERIHTAERPFKCTTCNKAFKQKPNLNVHIRTHKGIKPFVCTTCNRAFSQNQALATHIRTHTGEKPFKCTICDRTFAQQSSFAEHIRAHTGEKPFKCTFCSKEFSQKSTLTEHIRTHTGEKPLICTICNRTFAHRSNLLAHTRKHVEMTF